MARIPARRIGTDEDMAGVAIYLASRAGDNVVGVTITVDGGVAFARRLYLKQWRQSLGVNDASTIRQPQIQSDEMPVDA